MERNGNCLKERLKSGTRSDYQERVLSRERILNQECVLNHLEIFKRFCCLNITRGVEKGGHWVHVPPPL